MRKSILIFILLFRIVSGPAQSTLADSLKQMTGPDKKEDTTFVKSLSELGDHYVYDKPDSGLYYYNRALTLSKKLGYTMGEAQAQSSIGVAYFVLGEYAQSMQHTVEALNLYRQMKRPFGISSMENSIGDLYLEIGDYKKSLYYYLDARKIDEENPDDLTLMIPDLSMDDRLGYSDVNIANAYLIGNMLDSALFFAKRGFASVGNFHGGWSYPALILGRVFSKMIQFDSALHYYQLKFILTGQNDLVDINNGIAQIYRNQNYADSCRYYATLALDTAQMIHYRKGAMQAAELLSWVYEKTHPAEAIHYYKMSIAIKDSLYNQEKVSRLNDLVFSDMQNAGVKRPDLNTVILYDCENVGSVDDVAVLQNFF